MRSKRIVTLLMAVAFVMATASAGLAATIFQKTDVPAIPKSPCYQAGSISEEAPDGASFCSGDVIEYTLNSGVTICKTFNFFIPFLNATQTGTGMGPLGHTQFVGSQTNPADPVYITGNANAALLLQASDAADDVQIIGIRVRGFSGSQQFTVTFGYLNSDGCFVTNINQALPSAYNIEFEAVEASDALVFSFFDTKTTFAGSAATAATDSILKQNGVVGDGAAEPGECDEYDQDILPEDNAICINTLEYNGEDVTVVPDSQPILVIHEHTFSGDFTIARIVGAESFAIDYFCEKADCPVIDPFPGVDQLGEFGDMEYFDLGTIDSCSGGLTRGAFSYSGGEVCDASEENLFIFKKPSGFFKQNQEFDITLKVLVNGGMSQAAYLQNTTLDVPDSFGGIAFGYVTTLDVATRCDAPCTDGGTVTPESGPVLASADANGYIWEVEYRVRVQGDDWKGIVIDPPTIHLNSALLAEGDEITVAIDISQVPCGTVASGELCVATITDDCPEGDCVLEFPYFTAPNDPTFGAGIGLTNIGSVAGTADILLFDSMGGTGVVSDVAFEVRETKTWTLGMLLAAQDGGSTIDPTKNVSITVIVDDTQLDGVAIIWSNGNNSMYGYQPRQCGCVCDSVDS